VDNTDSSQFDSDPLFLDCHNPPSSTIFLDCETTTHNKGHPFDPRNRLVSYVVNGEFHYHSDPNFRVRTYGTAPTFVGFNIKFDLHWVDVPLDDVKIWDCQLAEFVLSGQKDKLMSLDETLERYGLPLKKGDLVKEYWAAGVQTDKIPVEILKEYNLADVEPLPQVFQYQWERCSPLQRKLVFLLGEDMKVLMEMERKGIKFDKEGAQRKLDELKRSLEKIEEQLRSFLPPIQHGVFNWDSGDHLSALLYGGELAFDYATEEPSVYKSGDKKGQEYVKRSWHVETCDFPQRFKPLENSEVKKTRDAPGTTTKFYQTDDPTLKQLTTRNKESKLLLSLLAERAKQIKLAEMLTTLFEKTATMNWQDGCIHPQYNQNIVATGRLSSSGPNMQNQPPAVDEFLITRYP